jgi:2-oxoglutarate ferredoxin oxidoreductase subunit gamma
MLDNGLVKIIIAGEGGQGVQTIGELLAEAAYISGKKALYIPNFGVEQRGGVSIAFVQISKGEIGAPKFQKADLLVVLSQRSVERTRDYLKQGTIYLYDESNIQAPLIDDQAVGVHGYDTVAPEAFAKMVGTKEGEAITPPKQKDLTILGIPAAKVAKEQLTPRVFNIIILGALVSVSKVLEAEKIKEALERKLGEKFKLHPELRKLNFEALESGIHMGLDALTKEE